MSYMDELNFWLNDDYFDQKTKEELLAIRNNEAEVEDRFYKELEFGTGGLRGVIGAGTNRMNVYTVRKATQGLANYIIKRGTQSKGVAIAFDSRRMSPEFSDEARPRAAPRPWPSATTAASRAISLPRPPQAFWQPTASRHTFLNL